MSDALGLGSGTVRVVPYDPRWADLYEAEVARLAPHVASHGVSLTFEHMGSTAVVGLAARDEAQREKESDGKAHAYSTSSTSTVSPVTRWASAAAMKSSRSPSSTSPGEVEVVPVRRSFTSWYG